MVWRPALLSLPIAFALSAPGCSLDWSERSPGGHGNDLETRDAGGGGAAGAGLGGGGASGTGGPRAAGTGGAAGSSPPQAGAAGIAGRPEAGSPADTGCPSGFAPDTDGECADIDECAQQDRGGCSPAASCRNIAGGRICTCEIGFEDTTGDGTACVHACELAGCDEHANCSLVAGEARCECPAPYIGDGQSCVFDEACALLACDEHAECVMSGADARACRCSSGYTGSGETCTNVDECQETPAICGPNTQCSDNQGAYDCSCLAGFEPATSGCSNIDDCDPNPCGPGDCTDEVNGYDCECPKGFDGDRCEIEVPTCCPTGDCLCHGPDPTALTAAAGPFGTASYALAGYGCVYHPTDAEPPFAAVAIADGFQGVGGCGNAQTSNWGPLYASHGIVAMIVETGASDQPQVRGQKLLHGIDGFKAENANSGSPLFRKLAGRYGASGFSMGGGGSTYAVRDDPTLRTNVAIMPWTPLTSGIGVPTLIICGSSDMLAPCSSHGTPAYDGIPDSVPKMRVLISSGHVGQPTAGASDSGKYGLAFQKVFLAGDERWRPFLLAAPVEATNIE